MERHAFPLRGTALAVENVHCTYNAAPLAASGWEDWYFHRLCTIDRLFDSDMVRKMGSFHETAKVVNSLQVSPAGMTRCRPSAPSFPSR